MAEKKSPKPKNNSLRYKIEAGRSINMFADDH